MRHGTRKSKRPDPFEIICDFGDSLREKYGLVRYAEYIYHNGKQWTLKAGWERFVDGEWTEIEDSFFDHST